jgi:flagellar hook-associated protein 2
MITATGIGSGIDIDTLVAGLVDAERQPIDRRLTDDETRANALLSAFGDISTTLTALNTSVKSLATPSSFQATSTTSSSSSLVSATSDETAVPGSYVVSVTDIAKAQTLSSKTYAATTDVVGTGTLSITVGSGTPVSITVDSTNNTLSGIRDAINAASVGATASIVKDGSAYRLLVTSDTGASNALSLSVSGDGDGTDSGDDSGLSALNYYSGENQMTQRQAAQDASFTVNGLPLTSATNTITDIVDGIDLTISQATTTPVTITVTKNTDAVVAEVESFVALYNSFYSSAKALTKYDASTSQAGVLQGDFTAKAILTQMRQSLTSAVTTSTYSTLSELGIGINAEGLLELNKDTFLTAWNADSEQVSAFFAGSSTADGLADGIEDTLSGILNATGSIASRTDALTTELATVALERAKLDARLVKIEARYLRQFNAMDALVAQLTSTGVFLKAQFDALPGFVKKD